MPLPFKRTTRTGVHRRCGSRIRKIPAIGLARGARGRTIAVRTATHPRNTRMLRPIRPIALLLALAAPLAARGDDRTPAATGGEPLLLDQPRGDYVRRRR